MNFFRTDAINSLDKKQKQASLTSVGYHGRRQFDNNLTETENPKLSTWHRSVFFERLGHNNHSFACFAHGKEFCLSRFCTGGSIIFIIIVYPLQIIMKWLNVMKIASHFYFYFYFLIVYLFLICIFR